MKAAESASAPRCSQPAAAREVLFCGSRCRGGFTGEKNNFWGLQRDFPLGARLCRPGGFPLAPWTPSGPCCGAMYPPNRFPVESKEQLYFPSASADVKITLSTNRRPRFPTGAPQTVKKPSGGVGGAAAPLTFLRVSRLCRLRGSLILLAKSIPYKFGRPLVDRICFLEKVASATFSTR